MSVESYNATVLPSAHFEILYFVKRQPECLKWSCGRVVAREFEKNVTRVESVVDLPLEAVVFLRFEWLSRYLWLKVKNRLFDVEKLVALRRTHFLKLYDRLVHDMNTLPYKNDRDKIEQMLESYASESSHQLDSLPQAMYQRGMLWNCKSAVSLLPTCWSSKLSDWLLRLLLCQRQSVMGENEISADACLPKVALELRQYVVEIPQREFGLHWSRGCDAVSFNHLFQDETMEDERHLGLPLESKECLGYWKNLGVIAQRLVLAHHYVGQHRLSEALVAVMSCWIPFEMVQRIDFYCVLMELGAELHFKMNLQCRVVESACEYVTSVLPEFTKQVLVPSVLKCLLRWGYFEMMESFYVLCAGSLTAGSCYEAKAVRLMTAGYIEVIENYLLFIMVYRRFHANCRTAPERLSCVKKLGCVKQFGAIELYLEKLEILVRGEDYYAKGLFYFCKYLARRLRYPQGAFEEERKLAENYFLLEDGPESKVMARHLMTLEVDLEEMRQELGRESAYYHTDFGVSRLLTRLFISWGCMAGGKGHRYLCRQVLKQYKISSHGRSYRLPLLRTALNVFVVHRRHFVMDVGCGKDESDSFDESDVNDEFKKYCSVMLSESLCQINAHQRKLICSDLLPNIEKLRGGNVGNVIFGVPSCDTGTTTYNHPHSSQPCLTESLESFFLSDSSLLGRHLFYGLQKPLQQI